MKTGIIIVSIGVWLAGVSVAAQSTGGIEREVRNLRLSQQESEKMMMDQFKKINDFLVQIRENYAIYAKHISALSKKLAVLEKENALLKSEIIALKKAIADESLSRKKAMERFAGVVASQASLTPNTPNTSGSSSRASSGRSSSDNGGPAGEGEFYEYVVQKGGTLSAIAKAYGVSINDIKTANRLKGNTIFVGQKLYIPVKK